MAKTTRRAATAAGRRAKPHEAAFEAHKASWSQKRAKAPKLDLYNEFRSSQKVDAPHISGKVLDRGLERLFNLTGDRDFEAARVALKRYGLNTGQTVKRVKALRGDLSQMEGFDKRDALEVMSLEEAGAKRKGLKFSARDWAARLVDEYNLPGASFDRAVEDLRKAFGRLDKSWRFEFAKLGKK